MRSDDLTMLFPLGLGAPSPWTASRAEGEAAYDGDPGAREPRGRWGLTLGMFLVCPFRGAACAR